MQLYQEFANDDRPASTVADIDPTMGEVLGARVRSSFELNPTQQLQRRSELGMLEAGPKTMMTEMGVEQEIPGISPDDPRARVLSLEEANEKGKALGLRFSEPPSQGQYDYLAELKQAETERNLTISKSSGIATAGLGLLADFAAQAVDPLNIATAFVPVVREARFGAWAARYGMGFARVAKGGIEGAVGAALVTPLIYSQAQDLQQEYGLSDAFLDVVLGAGLGSGLHYAGGKIADTVRAARLKSLGRTIDRQLAAYDSIKGNLSREYAPSNMGDAVTVDWRSLRVPEGELPHIVEAMDRSDRAKLLGAAVKAMESDNWPKMDELLRGLPEAKGVALTDKRYPAIQRMQSSLTAADFIEQSPLNDIIDQHLYRTIPGANDPDSGKAFKAVFKHYAGQTKKMKDWSIWIRPDEAYRNETDKGLLEHPEQKAHVDADAKTVVVSDTASLGALRHEIERAMDGIQGYKGGEAGAYRYRRGDNEGPVIHRKMLSQLYKESTDRAPPSEVKPEQAVDLFSRPEPIMKNDDEAAQQIWDTIEQEKDKDLDTLIKEEEIEVLEDTLRHVQNDARAAGAIERVIPIEERDLFTVEASQAAHKGMANKVEQAVQEAVDMADPEVKLYNQIRSAMDADPDVIRAWLSGDLTDEQFDELAGKPLPEKAPEPGEEPKSEDDLFAEMEAAVTAELKGDSGEMNPEAVMRQIQTLTAGMDPAKVEDMLVDFGVQISEIMDGMTPADLMDVEAKLVTQEQQLLSGNRAVNDLFNESEKAEFDEANSKRAHGASQGADGAVRGASAGPQPARPALEDGLFATRSGGDGPPVAGKSADIDAERSTAGGERSAPDTARSIGLGTVPTRVITPDGSIEVGVEPVILEWDDLRKAEGRFQPRDRTRKESDANIRERANRLDPEQLMPTRVSDSGPPIITKDGMVISGNGRYATIGQVYDHITLEPQAARYRERLGSAADGYRKPILVMRITDDLSEEALVQFADRSNRGRIEQMSATEKAQRDVNAAGIDLMQLYQGGDFESRENRQFLQAFLRKVATTTELGEISKNGRLTKEGYDRLNAAVLAAAYDDTGVLSVMLESADDNIRSITSAYRDVAPEFMKLRAEIGAGVVKEEMDLTPYMMQAARIISEQRNKGVKISVFLAQQDAFNPLDKTVETLIRAYYNKDLTRAVSALRIGEYLTNFVAEARLHQGGGFFPDETRVGDVLGVAERKRESQGDAPNAEDPTGLLGAEPSPVESAPPVRNAAPEPAPDGPSKPAKPDVKEPAVTKQPLTVRAAKLESLKGNKAEFDAYVKKLGNLKKVDMELTAESYLSRTLTAAERKTKQTVIDALTATVTGEPGAAPAPAPVKKAVKKPAKAKSAVVAQQNADTAKMVGEIRAETAEVVEPNSAKPPVRTIEDLAMVRERMGSLDAASYLSKQERLAWQEWRKTDTDFRSRALSGMDPGEAAERQAELIDQGQLIIAAHDRAMADDLADEKAGTSAADLDHIVEAMAAGGDRKALADFYTFLRGEKPVKSIANLAKAMKIPVEQAGRLIDHGIESGWIKMKDDGTVIRVPRKDRPVEPSYAAAPAGWGDIEGGTVPRDSADKVIKETQAKAVQAIAKREGLEFRAVMDGYGFTDMHDYVTVAQRKHGFTPDPAYINVYAERELQTQLVMMKSLNEAARILPENVRVNVQDFIFMPGTTNGARGVSGEIQSQRFITLAKQFDQGIAMNTVHHETVHALRKLGLFTAEEWRILTQAANEGQWLGRDRISTYLKSYEAQGTDPTIALDRLLEEGVATRYGQWAAKRKAVPDGPEEMLFDRIRRFLHELMKAFKQTFRAPTAAEIFEAINDGTIAQRWSDLNGGRVDDGASNSLRTLGMKAMIEDSNFRLKELADDGSQKIGNAAMRSAEALAPCAAYYL